MIDFLPEAGGLELRIDEQVVERVDRPVRHVGLAEQRDPFGVGRGADLARWRSSIRQRLASELKRGSPRDPAPTGRRTPSVTVGIRRSGRTVLRRVRPPPVEHAL
jgi:hypothetical protein